MGTISNKMNYLNGTKVAIHDAIVAKGVEIPVGSTFRSYASKIAEITSGGGSGGGSSGGSSSVIEWSQETYDAAFQASLNKLDPILSGNLRDILSAELSTGHAVAHVQVDNSDSEFAKLIVTFTGTCTIDWGDGTTSTPTSGVSIEHLYDYSNANLINLTGRTSKFAIINITCTEGAITGIIFNDPNTTSQRSKYIAINAAGNFLSSISVSSILTLEYFKSSKNIISDMNNMFNNCASLTTIPLLDTSKCTTMNNMFQSCVSLTTIPLLDTSVCTNMDYMFQGCTSLTTIPLLSTSVCTTMNNMFQGCTSLTTIPLLNTSACTSMNSMFNNCYSLTAIPLLSTSVCTSMSYMFNNCYSLTTVPLLSTSTCTNMSYMFNYCYSLATVPSLNTSACTNMSYMFSGCYSLTTIPLLDTSKCTSMSAMFYYCYSLTTIPLLNTSACTSMNSMFNNCVSLTTVPLLDTSKCTNMSYMFFGCYSLTTVPALNTLACTSMTTMFQNCYSLATNPIVLRKTSNVQNNRYSAATLNQIYTNLPTATGQTLTVTGNWGTSTDDVSIATAKGWTISG